MKNRFVLFKMALLSLLLVACDKHEKRETKHDNGQLKEQFSVLETKDGSFIKDGEYKTWYETAQSESVGQYEQGKKVGNWKHWYKNGQMESDYNYVKDTLDGKYVRWFENGQKSAEGTTNKLIDVGEFTSWYDNGQMKSKLNYKEGKQEGLQITWFDNGQKSSEYTILGGKYDGQFKNWNRERKLIANRIFLSGGDKSLPKKFKNKGGSTIELTPDWTFKLTYQVTEWFRSSWKTETGSLTLSEQGQLFLDGHIITKFSGDTLAIDLFRGAEYNLYRATDK